MIGAVPSVARAPGARALAAALLLSTAACGSGTAESEELLVSAASDMALAMPELARAFEARHGVRLVVNLGSTGQLAQQVLNGAPVDVLLSADRIWVDRLQEAGRLLGGGRSVYAHGELVLYGPAVDAADPATARFPTLLDAAARIAIANPDHAPYGRAAQEALTRAGVLEAVRSRLVIAESVRQAAQYAKTGSVDAAIVARSLMADGSRYVAVPDTLHSPLEQTLAIIAPAARPEHARAFADFLLGAEGREILRRHGFVLPD